MLQLRAYYGLETLKVLLKVSFDFSIQQFQEGKQVDPNMYGIIQRSLRYLFKQLNQQRGSKVVRASYLEIYNEQVSSH